jgi:FAD/FMN-containing dehydrogenase
VSVLAERTTGLAGSVKGQVIDRSHPEYDLARAVFNGAIDRRPEVIVRPIDVDDVRRAIEFSRVSGLPLSVRGGGHNVAGHSVCDDGVVIDLRLMRDVRVDPLARTAEAGGGATWIDFDPVCQRHGLATPGGTFGTTGVAGLTLGGGIGHLLGRFGLTLDNLLGAEVVTADGDVVVAAEDEHPDLFWALRGGGGNFGVVTRFVFRVHELGTLVGGLLVYGFERAEDVLRRARDVFAGAPDELTCIALLTRDRVSGDRRVAISVCWSGTSTEAQARLDELRAIPGLVADVVRPLSYLQLQSIFGELPFGLRHYWKSHFVRELPDDAVAFAVEHFSRRTSPLGTILVEPLQGLATRIPEESTAFANRGAAFNLSGLSIWDSPAADGEEIAWARAFGEGISPYSYRGGGYLNYMGRDEPLERVEAAFGREKFTRLREIKRRYDPDNVFRQNQNIPPAAG